jgi:hypothetical protein
MEDHEPEVGEPAELLTADEESEAPSPPSGLGAIGQLGVAVLVVALLITVFIGGSAVVRRIFG